MKRIISNSAAETEKIGAEFAKSLNGSQVIAFYGDLGAGKTAFIRGMAKGFGLDAEVSSPTFALVHEYGGSPLFCHFDMYRVDSWEDLYSTGFFDYIDMGAILAVEWSENIENALPDNTIRIEINKTDKENQRIITINTVTQEKQNENSCN